MHTDTPITLRLENGSAAIVGSGRPESLTLYHRKGNYVTADSPGRTAAHEPRSFLGYSREVIVDGGEVVRQIDRSKRWRPSGILQRDHALAQWNEPKAGDLVVTGTIERITGE